ncbi:MAG: hypothetical protein K0B81_01185 [Candidatus Cloacimonetes bacterium]|nr:hypothetical protein [Candidatus Cloacimonadota bacterium]
MTVILSMKTFQRLEEKLGAESAKEVYGLAEAIYEEVEKKFESKLDHFELLLQDTEKEDYTTKTDLIAFRRDITSLINSNKEEIMNSLQLNIGSIRRSLGRLRVFLLINFVLILLIIGYLVKPFVFSGV